jgi:hypothetical protein
MHDSKLDMSSLDPSQNAERWDRLIESIADRAVARRQQRLTISYQLQAWSRPVLVAAAAVALIVGAKALVTRNETSRTALSNFRKVYVLAEWAGTAERPAPSNVLQVLGEPNVSE